MGHGLQWSCVGNATSIQCGDGAGGIQTLVVPNFGSSGVYAESGATYPIQCAIIAALLAAWSSTVGSMNGSPDAAVAGTGPYTVGYV